MVEWVKAFYGKPNTAKNKSLNRNLEQEAREDLNRLGGANPCGAGDCKFNTAPAVSREYRYEWAATGGRRDPTSSPGRALLGGQSGAGRKRSRAVRSRAAREIALLPLLKARNVVREGLPARSPKTVYEPVLKTERNPTGVRGNAIVSGRRQAVWTWPDLEADLRVKVTGNLLDDPDIAYRDVTINLHEAGQAELLAMAAFSMFQSPGGQYADENYSVEMDAFSQGALDLCVGLAEGFGPLQLLFRRGRTLAEFAELELLPGCRLKGQGTVIGWRLMHELHRRYGAWLFAFKP